MHALRLEQMAYFDAGLLGLIDLAAALEVPAVSLWTANSKALDGCQVAADDVRAVRRRLDDSGVVADSIEVFSLTSSPDRDEWATALELGAQLGAKTATVVDTALADATEAADALASFAAAAGEFGLLAGLGPTST